MAERIETSHPQQHAPGWWWNIREIILGANDGLVSTLAFVAGAVASLPEPEVIALATLMEVIAGSISMGFGAYLAARSRGELERRELAVERRHLTDLREEESGELERFLAKHNLSDEEVGQLATSASSPRGPATASATSPPGSWAEGAPAITPVAVAPR